MKRLPVLLALLAASAGAGCVEDAGPLRAELWTLSLQGTHEVTFSFTVRNAGEHDAFVTKAHVGARQFDRDANGTLHYGEFGHAVAYPASNRHGGALFNDSELLKPGEARRFTVPMRFPPQADVAPGEAYAAHLVLDYAAGDEYWRTTHTSPCLRADGAEGEGIRCGHLFEHATDLAGELPLSTAR